MVDNPLLRSGKRKTQQHLIDSWLKIDANRKKFIFKKK